MPITPHRPLELSREPFRGSAAIDAALLTRAQLRSSAWRRIFPDVYVDVRVPDTLFLRVRGAALRLPPGAIITGRSAAHLWGAALGDVADPIEVLSPRGFGPVRGMVIRVGGIAADEKTACRDVPTCTPLHTAWEIARSRPLLDAVCWIDALGRRRRLARDELIEHSERHRGQRGSRIATAALRLCDPRAESPPESLLRVGLVQAGLPAPVPQWTVLVDGYFVARVDLAWPQWKFAIEYDGQWHADREQLHRDRRRVRELNQAGWYVYPVTREDLRDMDRLVRNIADLLLRRERGILR